MNLYLIYQDSRDGYDTYDSAVVCAANEDEARQIHPSGHEWSWEYEKRDIGASWAATPDDVKVKLIGLAADGVEPGRVLASFNAG